MKRVAATKKKLCTLLDLCVSSLRRGHANLLCIVPILTDDPRRESASMRPRIGARRNKYFFITARDILAVTPPLQLLGTQLPLWAACAERGGVAFAWDLHDR